MQVEVQSAQENNKMLAQENLNYADNKIPSLRSQLHSLHTSISHTNEQLNQMLAQYSKYQVGNCLLVNNIRKKGTAEINKNKLHLLYQSITIQWALCEIHLTPIFI